ncbi:MAG: UxaA family hydrolase [Eubacteriaceae bacterium]
MRIDAILINEKDNVATALREIDANENIIIAESKKRINFSVKEKILYGHKFSINNIDMGEDIIKYGEVIGKATQEIPSGYYAHVHNIESLRGRGDLERK